MRKLALDLPESEERETWGTATFRVRNKIFAMFGRPGGRRGSRSTRDEQAALVEMESETFFVPPYVGPKGWIGVHCRSVDAAEMRELITEAWRMTAPKRPVAAFDEETG